MSIFAQASEAPAAKTDVSRQVAVILTGLLVIMAVAQLFTFEDFSALVISYNLPFSGALQSLVAPLLVASEVLAIPFLLRMRLSVAFRWLSMFLGWLVSALWIFISIWLLTSDQSANTVGFLGTVGELTPGIWAILMAVALAILSTWASWGMWPVSDKSKSSKKD